MARDAHQSMNPWPQPSVARQALKWLLDAYPLFDILKVEWQVERADGRSVARWSGPWVLVDLGQPSERIEVEPAWAVWKFAILRSTGAVHVIGADGVASDDPIYAPSAAGSA